jgi:hypothetical protein
VLSAALGDTRSKEPAVHTTEHVLWSHAASQSAVILLHGGWHRHMVSAVHLGTAQNLC